MTSLNPKIAAIVVTFNRKALLIECLDHLLAQTCQLSSIIVVNNASTDGTLEILEKYKSNHGNKVIEILNLNENLGGAGGFYNGLKSAIEKDFDAFWLMDDDCLCDVNSLKLLIESPQYNNNQVGVLASKVIDTNGVITQMNIQRNYDFKSTVMKELPIEQFDRPSVEADISSFVGYLVKRNVVERVGLPRHDFFIYYDDAEYSIRIRLAGLKIVVITSSVIIHKQINLVSDGSNLLALWKLYYGQRNYAYTSIRVTKGIDKLIFWLRYTKGMLLQAISHLKEDRKFLRIWIDVSSYIDGMFGILGKRIDPTEWSKRVS